MIIKRKKSPQTLYYISSHSDLEGEYINPVAPSTSRGGIQGKLPIIPVYPDITKALAGSELEYSAGQKLWIYTPLDIRPEYTRTPGLKELAASPITGETWITRPTRFRALTEIEITGKGEKDLGEYKKGPRQSSTKLKIWKFKEVLKPWEKRGKLE